MAFQSIITSETIELATRIEEKVRPYHQQVDERAFINQQKV